MEPNKSKTYSDFIGPRQSVAGSLTESACVDVILGYLRKFHLDEIDALIPESVFQLPFPHEGKTFWNNECTVEYTDDVIFDIYFTNPTIFFDYVRKGVSALKKEKGSASSAWMYLQIKLIEDRPYDLSEIKPHMVNTPVCFDAVVLGLEPRTMYIKTAWYECPKGHPGIDIQCDKHRQLHPQVCTHSLGIDACGEKMFLNVDKSTQDYSQNIVIQEPIENTKFGNPIEYDAKITGKMVGDVRVSQKMRMSAVLRTVIDRKKNENEIYYDILSYKDLADSKEVLPTEEEIAIMKKDVEEPDFMLKLIKSFAPEVYGLDSVKESLILGLAGGVRSRNKRGSVNILLLGDPSTAKSTLLKECAEVITKSLYTSGKSASAAGLTAAAVKRPNGAWMIMPGVVVLCNDGFVFIDEIDKATPEDRSSLHEAMEQQTVSIAKAGMHMTFPARTAVFAAGNPQTGKWELSLSAAENVNLPPTLLSRFDVKWRILDKKDFSRDTNMAEHILSQFTDPAEEIFSKDYLRKYFAYINKLKPKLTKDAQKELLNTYRKLRDMSKDQESVVIDTRQLEGLIRLSTAHAKCYFHETIVEADVVHAVKVYYESLKSFGFDPEEGTVDQSTFFTSAKLNKETTFWNAFTALDDEAKGGVDAEELMVKLSSTPHYDEESARQEVEKKHSKENKIYMSKTGRYMRV